MVGVAALDLALARMDAGADHVADDDRDAAERGHPGSASETDLHAEVERVSRAELVDRAAVHRDDATAVGFLSREPEDLDVRIPAIGDRVAQRRRQEMLHEVRLVASRADAADTVV